LTVLVVLSVLAGVTFAALVARAVGHRAATTSPAEDAPARTSWRSRLESAARLVGICGALGGVLVWLRSRPHISLRAVVVGVACATFGWLAVTVVRTRRAPGEARPFVLVGVSLAALLGAVGLVVGPGHGAASCNAVAPPHVDPPIQGFDVPRAVVQSANPDVIRRPGGRLPVNRVPSVIPHASRSRGVGDAPVGGCWIPRGQ
jgi:heme A synthase